jgi:PAS domain-containing protein
MTTASNSLGETGAEARRALQIVESMLGHTWSADATGRFTYVSPNTLAFLGRTRHDLDPSEDEFG